MKCNFPIPATAIHFQRTEPPPYFIIGPSPRMDIHTFSDIVGCFNLPHKNSPLQKIPEDPRILDTKFFLFTRSINFSHPEILHYNDDGKSLEKSSFNFTKPLKLVAHGYMSSWNEKGSLILANIYLKLYDCNVILMDWHIGARGPQYVNAAANTELVGRQLGMLLTDMVDKGLDANNIHLIGFSFRGTCVWDSFGVLENQRSFNRKDNSQFKRLDAASPLFRNNYLREKYKKLDRTDAHFVDVLHTDASPFVTDGFGLWQPIGHVDFFPNGGQEQPGCTDTRGSIVVTHLEGSLTREIACSHIRAFHLFIESVQNFMERTKGNKDICEFTAFSCPGGLPSFERGHCFPQLDSNNSLAIDPTYRTDIGRFGEDAKGEGVMYFTTRDSSQFCGTQLQASVQISQKTGYTRGILQLKLLLQPSVDFQIKCEILDYIMTGTRMNGLAVAKHRALNESVENITGRLSYLDLQHEENKNKNQTDYIPTLYIDRIIIRDMYGN
ncbi:hypothetical protein NQ318_002108, partial [Aromia moschata]